MSESDESVVHSARNASRRHYPAAYRTAWICAGVLLHGGALHRWFSSAIQLPEIIIFLVVIAIWTSASPFRLVLLPAWAQGVLTFVAIAIVYLLDVAQVHPLGYGPVVLCLLILSCFFRYPGKEVLAEDDIFSPVCWARVGSFFSDVRFSIYLLFGFVFGAGLSVPIAFGHFRMLFGRDLSGWELVCVGLYILVIGILGTWASLGAFGVWAGACGGRKLRFIVQVLGIVAATWLTLPGAIVVTLALMWWKGRKPKD